jgi:hypothetical protein
MTISRMQKCFPDSTAIMSVDYENYCWRWMMGIQFDPLLSSMNLKSN